MVDLNAIPNVPLKIIFAVHFILTTWAIQGQWSPDSYLFYNFFFLLSLMWGMHLKDSEEPLQFAISINGISILLDLFTLLIFYPSPFGYSDRFSVLMTILNLIFRPISILLLGKICATRMGLSDGGFPARIGEIFGQNTSTPGGGPRNSYEDIDSVSPHHQSVPQTVFEIIRTLCSC